MACCCGGSGLCQCPECLALADEVFCSFFPACGFLFPGTFRLSNACDPAWAAESWGPYTQTQVGQLVSAWAQELNTFDGSGVSYGGVVRLWAGVPAGSAWVMGVALRCGAFFVGAPGTWMILNWFAGSPGQPGAPVYSYWSAARVSGGDPDNLCSDAGFFARFGTDPLFPGFVGGYGLSTTPFSVGPLPFCPGQLTSAQTAEVVS